MPWRGRSPHDSGYPVARHGVRAWLRHSSRDRKPIRACASSGETCERDRPPVQVFGNEDQYEWSRDRVWDCRGQCCVVLDFHASPESGLNLTYIARRLRHYPDQYLVANLVDGVRLDADVELQSVFVPHLASLPLGYNSVAKELARLHSLGWYDYTPELPFWPMYLNGQGATARKLEPDRFRRTTEGGGPRKATFDSAGLQAISINDASRIHHMPAHFLRDLRPEFLQWLADRGLPPSEGANMNRLFSKWLKEIKPFLWQIFQDLAILRRGAYILGEPIYIFNDDAKDYFNQLAIAECDLHKLGIVFLDEAALDSVSASAHLIFVSERRLGFGTHGASNIAQRFSDALLNLFRIDMDTADADTLRYGLSGPMDEWLSAREAVAAATQAECADRTAHTREPVGGVQPTLPDFCLQTRLYTAYMFSDDPAFIVVGVERAILALRIWRRLTDGVGLLMAIPEKRALGSHAVWLGVIIFVSLGIAVIPLAKLLRASFTIHRVLNGGIAFSTYRSLCGLLEHFRDVCLVGKTTMFSLYDPHGANGASARGPDGWVTCSQLMRQQLNKWLVLIASCGGLNVKSAFRSCKLAPASLLKIISSVDACYGDTDPTGVGGFCHGLWWYFLVPLLDISLWSAAGLELFGNLCNFIILHDNVWPLVREGKATFVQLTDALNSCCALASESAASPLTRDIYAELIATAAFIRLRAHSSVAHLFSGTNVFADLVSRGKFTEFFHLCAQMGICPLYTSPSPRDRIRSRIPAAA